MSHVNHWRRTGMRRDARAPVGVPQQASPASYFAAGVHAVYNPLEFGSLVFLAGDVVLAQNTDSPGTRDLDLSAAPPLYVGNGLDGRPTLRFAANEYGLSDAGWGIAAGARPSVHAVMQARVVERKSWFSLIELPAGSLRHWGYLETSDTSWRQPSVSAVSYGGAAANVPGLHQSGFPASGHYARLNQGAKSSSGATGGVSGVANACFVGTRFNDSNTLNYLDCDVSLFVAAVDSVDAEAAALAYGYVADNFPAIKAALP